MFWNSALLCRSDLRRASAHLPVRIDLALSSAKVLLILSRNFHDRGNLEHVSSLAQVLQALTHPSKFLMARAGAALPSAAFRHLPVPEKGQCLVTEGDKLSLGC